MLAGIFIAGAVTKASDYGGHHDVFRADRVWLYATILTVGYMISRGLAKSGSRGSLHRRGLRVRFALWGLVLAAVVFIVSGGHVLFLPLFFLLPFGGLRGTDGATAAGGTTSSTSAQSTARTDLRRSLI